ncbi:MATE family efflux transporter [uncultured Clostridium sp.]|uniref:MATE family efflux transporter n=1 Tax=uncultured Clostridium sp. TaxID=59620 RepID=UPI0025FA2F01|nr:MATE family efflux transporter [uncultured Clostridium sp.]
MITLKTDLLKGNILKSLIIFAIPLLISNIFQQLYNTMDTMIVGNFLGDTSLAAIGACTAVYDLLVGFALGIGNGLSIVTARSYGSKDEKLLKKSVAGSVVIGIFITVIIMLVSYLFLFPLLKFLNTPAEIINESYSYISTLTLCVGVMFAYNLAAGLLRAIGNSIMPLVFLMISSVLNIILDVCLITVFNMGIFGAAVATVIAQGISAVLCIIYIYKKNPVLIPSKEDFSVDKELYKELLGQGLSMGFMLSIVSTGTVVLQTAINNLGYLIIAGHTSARKLFSFCMMPVATISLSLATFVSQNKGADQGERIRKAVRYGNLLALLWSIIISVTLFFGAETMVKILSGSSESVVIENGAKYLIINAPFFCVLGVLLNLRNALQGIGKKVVPLVSSIIELCGKILFVIFLIPSLKYFGVILCEPVIWCFMCMQLIYAFYRDPYILKYSKKSKDMLMGKDPA